MCVLLREKDILEYNQARPERVQMTRRKNNTKDNLAPSSITMIDGYEKRSESSRCRVFPNSSEALFRTGLAF